MPRSNRPRRQRATSVDEERDLTRALYGTLRTETKRGAHWNVQSISATSALKVYRCPGCGGDVPPGQAHTVAWRADGPLGDQADISARRHWHSHCWKVN